MPSLLTPCDSASAGQLTVIHNQGGTIRGSLNLPAQSLWQSLDTLYELCANAGVSLAIFYCGTLPPMSQNLICIIPIAQRVALTNSSGSSRGRGTRAAGWFQDRCNAHGGASVKGVVLLDGINGWAEAGQEYVELMDGYVPDVWGSQS